MDGLMTTSSVFYIPSECGDYNEYKHEFQQVIHDREKNRIVFLHQSPQISFRDVLVGYMKKVCGDKSLSKCCLHLAVYLLDIFMDNHSIIPEKLLLVANVCLLLAAKLEEKSLAVPKISELNTYVNNKYLMYDYTNLEILLIKFFRFFLKFPCAVHYVFYYINEIISLDDVNNAKSFRSLFYDVHEDIKKFLDQILDDVHYMQCYQPSKLAAAIISASRIENGLVPWTRQLEELTGYAEGEFEEIVSSLLMKNTLHCTQCTLIHINKNDTELYFLFIYLNLLRLLSKVFKL